MWQKFNKDMCVKQKLEMTCYSFIISSANKDKNTFFVLFFAYLIKLQISLIKRFRPFSIYIFCTQHAFDFITFGQSKFPMALLEP